MKYFFISFPENKKKKPRKPQRENPEEAKSASAEPAPVQNRALSLRQPYAEQVLRGSKKIEYRSRVTHVRGRVYLYASLTPDSEAYQDMNIEVGSLPTGVLVGTVEIAGCRKHRYEDEYEWELRLPLRLEQPIKPENHPQPVWFKPFTEP